MLLVGFWIILQSCPLMLPARVPIINHIRPMIAGGIGLQWVALVCEAVLPGTREGAKALLVTYLVFVCTCAAKR